MSTADPLDALVQMERIREALAHGQDGRRSSERLGELASSASKLGLPATDDGARRVVPPREDTLGDADDGVTLVARPAASHLPLGALTGLARTGWSLLDLHIAPGRRAERLCVRHEVPSYSVESAQTLVVGREAIELQLLPTFVRRLVSELDAPVEALLRVEIERLGKARERLYLQTFPFWLLPSTTAVVWLTGTERVDLRDNLASWVAPSAPAVLAALREAVEHTPDKRFTGYADLAPGVARRVSDQVRAIFEHLKSLELSYISSDLAIAGPGTIVQRVRTPAESLADTAANCIDGTVLYASLLLAAGIRPALVLLPGHAVLGWRRNPGATEWSFLETVATRNYSFEQACEQGEIAVRSAGSSVKIVDVEQMRRRGIYPAF